MKSASKAPAAAKVAPKYRIPLSRTKVSRHARAVRREFFKREAEHLFFIDHPTEGTPEEIARAAKRFATIKAKFEALTVHRAAKLEVPEHLAIAELENDDEGEE